MPPGTYYGIVGNLRPGKAGLTSAMLRRHELINQRLAASPGQRRMTLLTFSARDKDDVGSYGLTDGVDVLNVERHGSRPKGADGWISWVAELAAVATPAAPVYFICDGHEVGAVVAEHLSRVPHAYFVQVVHNPTTSAKYAGFRQAAVHADAIVCATERQARALETDPRHGGTACGRVPVHPLGYPRRDAAATGGARNERHIIMLTRVHWQKDIALAVESFHELLRLAERSGLDDRDELRLDIHGALESTAEVTRVRTAIEKHGLAGKVTLHGYTPGAFEKLATSSITWLTSRFEGWGLAITEAQLSGCIPVVIDEPFGPREQIEHGRDGRLVRAPAAQWLRRQEDKRDLSWAARAGRKAGRRIITPLSRHMARETLQVLEMDDSARESMREAGVTRVLSEERSPQTYIDNWIHVIEALDGGERRE